MKRILRESASTNTQITKIPFEPSPNTLATILATTLQDTSRDHSVLEKGQQVHAHMGLLTKVLGLYLLCAVLSAKLPDCAAFNNSIQFRIHKSGFLLV